MAKFRNLEKRVLTYFLITALILITFPQNLNAASLTSMSDTMSRIKASTASNHTIKYTTPTGVAAGQTMTVTFPTGFTMGSVAFGDVDVSWGPTTGAENELTLAATASGTTWGAAVTGQVLTITSGTGTITAASKVIIEIGTNATFGVAGVNQITNQTVVQNNTDPKIVIGGTFGDTGSIATEIVADDQVVVTTVVDPSLTFSLSANATDFGTTTTSAVDISSPDITLTTTTNAQGGFALSVRDQGNGTNAGLYSAAASALIASSTATLAAGTEGYGIQGATTVSGSGGAVTIDAVYLKTVNDVGGLQRTAQSLATAASPVNDREVVVTHKAAISGLTKAGSYTDTLTYIATGNF